MRCRCFCLFFSVSVIIVSGCKHHISTGMINSCGITDSVRLITLAPGHFHAALVQKVSYPAHKEIAKVLPCLMGAMMIWILSILWSPDMIGQCALVLLYLLLAVGGQILIIRY